MQAVESNEPEWNALEIISDILKNLYQQKGNKHYEEKTYYNHNIYLHYASPGRL